MIRTAIALIALMFAGCQAQAGWPHNQFSEWRDPAPRKHVHRHHHKPKVIYRTVTQPASTARCAAPLTREGDQYATTTGAKAEADKAWMQAARWKLGEVYMDISHAEATTYACGRSSVGSVAGNVFYRCEVTARPCRAPGVEEGK